MPKSKFKPERWLLPYLEHLNNTGGNDPIELLNRHIPPGSNDLVASMQISVASQVALLRTLYAAGLLPSSPNLRAVLARHVLQARNHSYTEKDITFTCRDPQVHKSITSGWLDETNGPNRRYNAALAALLETCPKYCKKIEDLRQDRFGKGAKIKPK